MRPGGPVHWPEATMQGGITRSLLGLAVGGWSAPIFPPGSGLLMPDPAELDAPAAWADSISVSLGSGAAWEGPRSTLGAARAFAVPPSARRTRAVFSRVSGGADREENALLVGRGDERGWFQAGAVARERGEFGSMGPAGEHMWTASSAVLRGAHEIVGFYRQAGLGARQIAGAGEGVRAESGGARWGWSRRARFLSLALERTHEGRDSYAVGSLLSSSRRDAAAEVLALAWGDSLGGGALGAQWFWRRQQAVRVTPGASVVRRSWRSDQQWLAARASRAAAGGTLAAGLGAGLVGGVGDEGQRLQASPSIEYARSAGAWRTLIALERSVVPVVTDLALGAEGWVQDAWTLTGHLGRGNRDAQWFEASGLVGRAGERALMLRYPIRDVALRLGTRRDVGSQPLALGMLACGWSQPRWRLEAQGHVSAAPDPRLQPRVDPSWGARAAAEGDVRLFSGDLALRLRIEGAWVGERDFEHNAYEGVEPRVLPSYATASASLHATLGDARFGFAARNLEDIRRPQVWLDPATGLAALGPGREVVFEVVWPLFD